MNVGLHTELMIKLVDGVKLYGAHLGAILHLDADAIGFLRLGGPQGEASLAVEQSSPLLLILRCLHLVNLAVLACVALRGREG